MNSNMTDPSDNPTEPTEEPEGTTIGAPEAAAGDHSAPAEEHPAEEETPDGGLPRSKGVAKRRKAATAETAVHANVDVDVPPGQDPPAPAEAGDDEPQPELVWYVLKVQSSREDTIRDALQRRVKIQGLEKYFGKNSDGRPRIVVPTEKITEIRNNKKRIVERKTYPCYIMVQMELNEKTWFLVRETPGVGDFVGAHGTPTKMTEVEVNQMLHQEEEKTTAETPKVRIDVERGDRVKIKDGPFENFEGTVEEVIEGRGLVKVMLIIFNRPTPVDLEYWQLERI
jgi:transcription termination/antitermination protein NusG